MTALVLGRASLQPGIEVDLVIENGRLTSRSATAGADVVDLDGRPVVPGLADHHIHLLGLAAAWSSVDCSPDALASGGGLDRTLRAARQRRPDGWLRAVGYDQTTSGLLDAHRLDAIGVGPIRVQDRTGIQWVLDGRGLDAVLPADRTMWPNGVQVDEEGEPTGVLVRLDGWLRDRISPEPPDLAGVGRWLAGRGVTAVTDAGASNGPDELALLARAGLDQRLAAMTREADVAAVSGVALGPVKVLLDDMDLPPLDELAGRIDAAHRHGRAVAVHCVTEVQAVLALSAGIGHRDRVEHGSLVSDDLLPVLAAADPAVIVQPGLVHTRGDRYLAEVDPRDRPGLHRLRSFQAAGLRVAASSDAPYGPADPWTSIAAAADRTTRDGRPLGPREALAPADALRLFTGHLENPADHRRLVDGEDADLVVLDDDWDRLARRPRLAATLIAGRVVAGRLPT